MYCENCSEPLDEQDVVRKHNRVLRRVVSKLRKSIERHRHTEDKLFRALCDTNPAAEEAMRELWESGQFTCGPQDYNQIIEQAVAALRAMRNQFEQAAQAHSHNSCTIPQEVGAYGWRCTRDKGHEGPCAAEMF